MKKAFLLLSALWCTFASLAAQEKYNEWLQQIATCSPYEALYRMSDRQQDEPHNPNIYYQMGLLSYRMLPTKDPLHHYTELSNLFYQSNLYLGNCLYFAKDQALKAYLYPTVPCSDKTLLYTDLQRHLRPMMDTIKVQKAAADSIYHSFNRLVERYTRCQDLFADFMNRYSREKTAHMLLNEEDTRLLEQLKKEAEQLPEDFEQLRYALRLRPIADYQPTLRWLPIRLYRLDGLTYTHFLQEDIVLWDYAEWAGQFLSEQANRYDVLMADIQVAYKQMAHQAEGWRVGEKMTEEVDPVLINRILQCDDASAVADWLEMQQTAIRILQLSQQADTVHHMRELFPMIAAAKQQEELTQAYRNTHRAYQQHFTAQTLSKYRALVETENLPNKAAMDSVLTRYEEFLKQARIQLEDHILRLSLPYRSQTTGWKDEMTGQEVVIDDPAAVLAFRYNSQLTAVVIQEPDGHGTVQFLQTDRLIK